MELVVVDLKETRGKVGKKPLLRFSLQLNSDAGEKLLQMNGFILFADGGLVSPGIFLNGGHRVSVVDLEPKVEDLLKGNLQELPKVREFLGLREEDKT